MLKTKFSYSLSSDLGISSNRVDALKAILSKFHRIIYFDTRDVNSMHQLEQWFDFNFFNKKDTLIITRWTRKGNQAKCKLLRQLGYQFLNLKSLTILPDLIQKTVYYPINAYSNIEIVRHARSWHIFIGHGDSDKLASVNPIIKIYTHILVAGDKAVQRLLSARIINQLDVDEGKVIKIGLPYLLDRSTSAVTKPFTKDHKKILYCPTWEGVSSKQQYSSLKGCFGAQFILNNFKDCHVFIKPHPSTGKKDKQYLQFLIQTIKLLAKNLSVTYIASWPNLDKKILSKCNNISHITTINYDHLDTSVVDLSSMFTFSLLHKCKPIVLNMDENTHCDYLYTYHSSTKTKEIISMETEYISKYRQKNISLSEGLKPDNSNSELLTQLENEKIKPHSL